MNPSYAIGPVRSTSRVSSHDSELSGSAMKPSTLDAVKYWVAMGASVAQTADIFGVGSRTRKSDTPSRKPRGRSRGRSAEGAVPNFIDVEPTGPPDERNGRHDH